MSAADDTAPTPEPPWIQLTLCCPRCFCQLPYPPTREAGRWQTRAVETECLTRECGWHGLVKFFAEQT